MATIISIANQKGGVAKTTTATALATGLAKRGYRTLLIDTDPQCNASDTYQAKIDGAATLYDIFRDNEPVENVIQHTSAGDIIPSDPFLSQAESLLCKTGKEFALKKAIAGILPNYDYIIIDTPPTLGVLLVNALTAATSVLIPISADRYSLQGLSQLRETISAAREYTNPDLKIAGLLLAKFNNRTNLSKDVADSMPKVAESMGTIVFDTTIRESTAARESQSARMGIFTYAPSSTTAQDYDLFINELLERNN